MDAAAYLKKQGWRGSGHSLDHTDRGIKKPLQISKKVDALGVGIQKYGAVSDQWWMRAYDQGLKDLGTGVEGDLEKVRKHGHERGGLYARFVKGQPIPGTIDEYLASTESEAKPTSDSALAVIETKAPKQRSAHDLPQSARSRKRKSLGESRSTTTTEKDTNSDQTATNVRAVVKMYVNEAIRLGIISPRNGSNDGQTKLKSSSSRPSEADMKRVLALAGLFEGQSHDRWNRQHKARALKRAAIQHYESTMDVS